jgi:hypothetical protein
MSLCKELKMTEQDCQQVYQELADLLRSLQLGWVVEQVQNATHDGIGDDCAVIVDGAATIHSAQTVLTTPAARLAQTQLHHLIDAVQSVVVDTTEMEEALVDFMADPRWPTPLTLEFAAEDESSRGQLVSVSPDRRQAVAELGPLLQALRQEASLGMGEAAACSSVHH